MGQMYSAQFNGVAVTAQQDLFELTAPSTKSVIVHRVILTQSTEVGDTQEEGLSILIKRGATTSGSGGSAPTPTLLNPGASAAGSAVEANNTTKASVGTIVTLHAEAWNVRGVFEYLPTPELRPELSGTSGVNRLTVELGTTPADSITMNGTLYFEEIG